MQPYGSDRVRTSAGKVILHSRISKGWTPRTLKSATHAEFPGTAVLWDDQYFEVLSADLLPAGGVRYVLAEWQDHHTIRTFEAYDEGSEARLAHDYEHALRQQRHSLLARGSGILLGHLPAPVQNRLANDLGLFPARMTLLSTVPSLVLFGTCVWLTVDATMEMQLSPVPVWLWAIALFMLVDSIVRFFIAMSQNRGTGSLPGTIVYALIWLLSPKRNTLIKPFEESRGEKLFTLPPSEEVARHDSVQWRSWMLTLLSPAEQHALAERYGFDYRKDAYSVAGAILAIAALGAISSIPKLDHVSGFISLVVAALVVLEQSLRLAAFKRTPAGSIFGILVRPFVRDLLR
jgi:hypothetical protein